MQMPGFTAEAGLYRSGRCYLVGTRAVTGIDDVVPQRSIAEDIIDCLGAHFIATNICLTGGLIACYFAKRWANGIC
jgi:hypothetical protein